MPFNPVVFFFRQLSQRRVRRRLRGWERWTGIIILSASSGLTAMMMMTVVIISWFRDDCDDDSDDHVYNDLGVRIVHWFCNLEWEERSVGRLKLTSSVTSEIIAIIVIVIVMVIMTITLILIILTLFCLNTNPCWFVVHFQVLQTSAKWKRDWERWLQLKL